MRTECVPYARKVLEHIESGLGPDIFDMSEWGTRVTNRRVQTRDDNGKFLKGGHVELRCGTAACIAGWACILDPHTKVQYNDHKSMFIYGITIEDRAIELLGLDEHEVGLFYESNKRALSRLRFMIKEAESHAAS